MADLTKHAVLPFAHAHWQNWSLYSLIISSDVLNSNTVFVYEKLWPTLLWHSTSLQSKKVVGQRNGLQVKYN